MTSKKCWNTNNSSGANNGISSVDSSSGTLKKYSKATTVNSTTPVSNPGGIVKPVSCQNLAGGTGCLYPGLSGLQHIFPTVNHQLFMGLQNQVSSQHNYLAKWNASRTAFNGSQIIGHNRNESSESNAVASAGYGYNQSWLNYMHQLFKSYNSQMNSDGTTLDSNQKSTSSEIPEDSKAFDVKDDERPSQDDDKIGLVVSGADGNERIPCEAKPPIDTNFNEVEGTNHKTSEDDGLFPVISSLPVEGIQCTSVTFAEANEKKDGDKSSSSSSSSSSQQTKTEDHPTVDVGDAKDVCKEISLSGRDQIGSTKVAENPDEATERETSVEHVKSMLSISSNESDNSMTSDEEDDEDEDDDEEDDEDEEEDDDDEDEDSSSTLERNSVTSSNAGRTCDATANNCPEVCHHASGCQGDDDRKEYAGKHDADENKKDRIHETGEECADESGVFPGRNRMTDSDKSIPDEDESGNRGYRVRSMIAGTQQLILKAYYKENPRPTGQELEQLAAKVCFSKRVVQVWFQNMRARDRRKSGKTPDAITSPSSPQIHSSITSAGAFGGVDYPVDSNPPVTGMFYSSPCNVSLSSPQVQMAQAPMISGIPATVNELHNSLLLNTPPYSLHQLLRQQLQSNINASYLAEKLRGRVGFLNVDDDSQRYAEQLSQSSQPTCFDTSSGCSKKERKVIPETNSTALMQNKLSSGYLSHYQSDHGDSLYGSNWMFRSSGLGFHGRHSFYAFTNEEPLDLSKHSLSATSCEVEKIKPDTVESNEILDLRMSKSNSTQSPSISQSVVDEESCEMDEKPSESLAVKESLATSPSNIRTIELMEDKQLVGSSNDKSSHQLSQSHAIYPETGKDFGQNCPFGLNGTPLEQYFTTTGPHYHHLASYSSYPLMLSAAMKSGQLPRSIHLANISPNKDWDFASLALDKMQQIRIRDLIEHTKNSTASEESLRIRKTSKKVALAFLWNLLKIF